MNAEIIDGKLYERVRISQQQGKTDCYFCDLKDANACDEIYCPLDYAYKYRGRIIEPENEEE